MDTLRTFACNAALLPALAASSQAAKPMGGHGDAQSCAALAGRIIAPDTAIQSAEYLPEGGMVGTTKIDVAFCRAVGVATPTADSLSALKSGCRQLPAGTAISAAGSGGSAGDLTRPHARRTAGRYATMSTDNGHHDPKDPLGGSGQGWAYKHRKR